MRKSQQPLFEPVVFDLKLYHTQSSRETMLSNSEIGINPLPNSPREESWFSLWKEIGNFSKLYQK